MRGRVDASQRQRILVLFEQGLSNKKIAERMSLSLSFLQNMRAEFEQDLQVEFPEELNTPEFAETWERWKVYRRLTLKKPCSLESQRLQLEKLKPFGVRVAIFTIQESIASEWQGLFPDKVQERLAKMPAPSVPTAPTTNATPPPDPEPELSEEQQLSNLRRIREMARQLSQQKAMPGGF